MNLDFEQHVAADLQRKADRIAEKIAEAEAKLDKANADIEHRKVDLLRLQSEGGSDAKCEDVEDSIEDEQRRARFLREMLAALEHKQMRINLDLREAEYAIDALQQHARADDMTAALDMEADHLHVRAQCVAEERERVRGDLEHARCEALRLQSEAGDGVNETFDGQRQQNAEMLTVLECKAEDLAALASQIDADRVHVRAQEASVTSLRDYAEVLGRVGV
jgi:hypothetical protein